MSLMQKQLCDTAHVHITPASICRQVQSETTGISESVNSAVFPPAGAAQNEFSHMGRMLAVWKYAYIPVPGWVETTSKF